MVWNTYPGDMAYTEKIQRLLGDMRAEQIPLPWKGKGPLQGKRQDAYELLQPVYAWFTEGF